MLIGAVLAVVAVIMLVIASGCVHPYTPIIRYDPMGAGVTACDQHGNPVIAISRVISEADLYFVMIHEQTHAQRMMGKCAGFMERYRSDPTFRFSEESAAYCNELLARVEAGFNRDTLVYLLAVHMRTLYADKLSVDSVRTLLPCGGRNESPP